MNIENTQSQMRKGVLEYCILSIIKRRSSYPGDIIEAMRGAGLQMLEGTLYPLLNRLKNAGVLSYHWEESTSGPPRKYFTLTEKGHQFYKMLEVTWNELATGVETLTSQTAVPEENIAESDTGDADAVNDEVQESDSPADENEEGNHDNEEHNKGEE